MIVQLCKSPLSFVCLLLRVGTQACPRCLRPAPAEGRTGEKAGSPYLLLLATRQERSLLRVEPLGKVVFRISVNGKMYY